MVAIITVIRLFYFVNYYRGKIEVGEDLLNKL